ncbi:hypothetical protein ACXPWS_16085 [Mycobacterium sp. BMJ-28]
MTTDDKNDVRESPTATTNSDGNCTSDAPLAEPTSERDLVNRRAKWKRVVAYRLLPALALVLAIAASYLKFVDASARDSPQMRSQSVTAATEGAIAMLSYRPDTAEEDLTAAQGRLTGSFRDSYIALTRDVVIPGAKQKQIGAEATVPAAASVSANENNAVVLVFVDQTITVGDGAPSSTASSIRVTLDHVNGRWLISAFDPI